MPNKAAALAHVEALWDKWRYALTLYDNFPPFTPSVNLFGLPDENTPEAHKEMHRQLLLDSVSFRAQFDAARYVYEALTGDVVNRL